MFMLLAAGLNFAHYLFSSQNNSRQCIIERNKWTCCTACTFENANTKERLVSPRHQHRAKDQARCWSGLAADRDRHESRANHYNPCRTDRLAHDRKHTYGAPHCSCKLACVPALPFFFFILHVLLSINSSSSFRYFCTDCCIFDCIASNSCLRPFIYRCIFHLFIFDVVSHVFSSKFYFQRLPCCNPMLRFIWWE